MTLIARSYYNKTDWFAVAFPTLGVYTSLPVLGALPWSKHER